MLDSVLGTAIVTGIPGHSCCPLELAIHESEAASHQVTGPMIKPLQVVPPAVKEIRSRERGGEEYDMMGHLL